MAKIRIDEILVRRYPGLRWTLHDNQGNESDYTRLTVSNGEKPSLDEIKGHWPAVQKELEDEAKDRSKVNEIRRDYEVHDIVLIFAEAILTGDKTKLQNLKDLWDSL